MEAETRFSALVDTKPRFSALVETKTRFSALVETRFGSLVETETCLLVRLLHHFRSLGGRLTSDDGVCGGGGGCDASSTARCAASAVSGMGG